MPEMKSRPILYSDKNYFYLIGGKVFFIKFIYLLKIIL